MSLRQISTFAACLLAIDQAGSGAQPPNAPVPVSPFVRVVYGYADAMLKHGREPSGTMRSALHRITLAPLTNRPAAPGGVRESERVGAAGERLTGSNPVHDENLLRLLSTLTDLTGKPIYRSAADATLKALIEGAGPPARDPLRPWMLWDRCLDLAPVASQQKLTRWAAELDSTERGRNPRADGFILRGLAVGFARTKDETFTRAIERWIERHESKTDAEMTLSLAIDCEGAARRVQAPLAARLRQVAATEDQLFLSLRHELPKHAGFSLRPSPIDPEPEAARSTPRRTLRWKASREIPSTAQVGLMCVSRYDNTGQVAYRDLLQAAAGAYLDSLPAEDDDVWPGTFGQAISLQIAAWRHSADQKYFDCARRLGSVAVEKFWGTNALPRASVQSDHYESITGADTLALALLELHLHILHITAVRCPSNTIDR